MRPRFLRLLCLFTLLVALSFLSRSPSTSSFLQAFLSNWSPPAPIDPSSFQVAALQVANRARARLSSPPAPLQSHPEAILGLEEFAPCGMEAPGAFDRLFANLQARQPRLHEIGSNLISASSQQELLQALASWPELTKPAYTHLATTVFHRPNSHETVCLAAILHELAPLELPVSRRTTATTYNTCRICLSGHGLTLSPQSQSTVSIRCPRCSNSYDLLAGDSSGNWRRATQFLEGLSEFSAGTSQNPEEQVLEVWRQVDRRCRYQLDPERIGGEDSWNPSRQTYALTWGDCEDTSILLADALISNGINARVALGRFKGKGHAWCVVRLGDRQFILESTADGVDRLRRLPRLDDVALDYEPDCLFDRETICFNRHHQWTANYWSKSTWSEVSYPPSPASLASK